MSLFEQFIERAKGPLADGPGGNCICPKCGEIVPHDRAEPCNEVGCPKCDTTMIRDEADVLEEEE